MANKLRSKDFKKIEIYSNKTISLVMSVLKKYYKRDSKQNNLNLISKIKLNPEDYVNDEILGQIALEFLEPTLEKYEPISLNNNVVELNVFGRPLIKSNAYQQMKTAMKLPTVRKAALMPDSHLGYGLPIGGVLATENTVIPYAIGMDIGCRMSLTLYPITERFFKMHQHKFKQSLIKNTAFGIAKAVGLQQEHEFLDRDELHY